MLTCGPNGSTGAEIIAEINRLGNLPISKLGAIAPLTAVTISTTPSELAVGDIGSSLKPGIQIDTGVGFTFDTAGIYTIEFNASVSYDINEVFNIDGLLAGTSMSGGNGIYITGRGGSNPMPVSWTDTFEAAAGDQLRFSATAVSGSGTLTVYMSSITVRAV